MKVIAGLGNPGAEYANTPHSIGFEVVDAVARGIGASWKGSSSFKGELATGLLGGVKVLLVKPQTYMNLSGDCLQQVMHFYKLPPEKLIVLCDDVDLPCGSLRIRAKGSAGTHNGLRSIIACLNSENFPRIRIGAGQDVSLQLRDYVLKRPGREEAALLSDAYEKAADAAALIVKGDVEGAQSRFNKRHEKNPRQSQADE